MDNPSGVKPRPVPSQGGLQCRMHPSGGVACYLSFVAVKGAVGQATQPCFPLHAARFNKLLILTYMLCCAPCLMRAARYAIAGLCHMHGRHSMQFPLGIKCDVAAAYCSSSVEQWNAAASLRPKLEALGTALACSFQARPVVGRVTPRPTTH